MKTHTNLALVYGEVYVYDALNLININTGKVYKGILSLIRNKSLIQIDDIAYPILASTADLDGIPKLERKWFVKPVDVEELVFKHVDDDYNYLPQDEFNIYSTGFITGYNTNKAEFTRDEMEQAMEYARNYAIYSNNEILNIMHPLSLPKSITLNDTNEIISVEW